jgi:Na+-transporting methylmalonyl-CoA/oxaloacetate decarboxylase gamma subunit
MAEAVDRLYLVFSTLADVLFGLLLILLGIGSVVLIFMFLAMVVEEIALSLKSTASYASRPDTGVTERTPIRLDEQEVLGVVAYGIRHSVHGTSERSSSIDPTEIPTAGTRSRFQVVSRIVVTVEDPAATWNATSDPEGPVRSLVRSRGSDNTADGQVIGDLSADRLEQALADDGLAVLSTEAQRQIEQTYDIEVDSGDWYEITVSIDDEEISDEVTDWDDLVLPALRDGLANSDEYTEFDAHELADRLEHPAIDVEAVSSCDSAPESDTERQTLRSAADSSEHGSSRQSHSS